MANANKDVREAIESAGIFYWQVAAELGVVQSTFCIWLRTEMPEEKKKLVFDAIKSAKRREEKPDGE